MNDESRRLLAEAVSHLHQAQALIAKAYEKARVGETTWTRDTELARLTADLQKFAYEPNPPP